MAVAASDLNTEIVQFDWFISSQIFPKLPTQGEILNTLTYIQLNKKYKTFT